MLERERESYETAVIIPESPKLADTRERDG